MLSLFLPSLPLSFSYSCSDFLSFLTPLLPFILPSYLFTIPLLFLSSLSLHFLFLSAHRSSPSISPPSFPAPHSFLLISLLLHFPSLESFHISSFSYVHLSIYLLSIYVCLSLFLCFSFFLFLFHSCSTLSLLLTYLPAYDNDRRVRLICDAFQGLSHLGK